MALTAAQREDLIRRYEEGPRLLRDAFAKVPREAWKWRPEDGKWSAQEVVCHCADSEMNGAMRLRYLLAEKDPVIVGYDQDAWARILDYHSRPLEPALSVVEAVRAHTTALLRALGDDAWSRAGRHTDSGAYSVESWLRIYSDHLEGHARQIERNLEAWRSGAGSVPPTRPAR